MSTLTSAYCTEQRCCAVAKAQSLSGSIAGLPPDAQTALAKPEVREAVAVAHTRVHNQLKVIYHCSTCGVLVCMPTMQVQCKLCQTQARLPPKMLEAWLANHLQYTQFKNPCLSRISPSLTMGDIWILIVLSVVFFQLDSHCKMPSQGALLQSTANCPCSLPQLSQTSSMIVQHS